MDKARQKATDELHDWIRLRGRDRFRFDRAVSVAVEAFVAERVKDPEVHDPGCHFKVHYECCTRGLRTCDCLIGARILNVEGTSE